MPSTSKKQHNFMAAVANSPKFAKRVGVSQAVGAEFLNADKGRKFKEGGDMATKSMKALFSGKESKKEEAAERKAFPSKAAYKKAESKYEGEKYAKGGGVATSLAAHAKLPASKAHNGLKSGGLTSGHKSTDGIAKRGKTQATAVKMARGGKCK